MANPTLKRSLSSLSTSSDESAGHHPIASTSAAAGPSKASRSSPQPSSSKGFICSLPPSCNLRPSRFDAYYELEAHHRTSHQHLCSAPGCGKVFPDDRFLTLHLDESHNVMLEIQRERGQPTFRCFEQSCPRTFNTVKGRRLHLIDVHQYPKAFFFTLPLHGLGELFARYGPGASLVGPGWKPRSNPNSAASSPVTRENSPTSPPLPTGEEAADPAPVDELTESLEKTRLDMVPPAVRFGRAQRRTFIRGNKAGPIVPPEAMEAP